MCKKKKSNFRLFCWKKINQRVLLCVFSAFLRYQIIKILQYLHIYIHTYMISTAGSLISTEKWTWVENKLKTTEKLGDEVGDSDRMIRASSGGYGPTLRTHKTNRHTQTLNKTMHARKHQTHPRCTTDSDNHVERQQTDRRTLTRQCVTSELTLTSL